MFWQQRYQETFSAIGTVLNEVDVPASLEPMVRSLKQKLESAKAEYDGWFEGTDGRVRTPSMGVIEMTSEKSEEPRYYFGTPLKARDFIRLRVFQASLNPNTEEVFKEELISEVVLTEKQFGDVICQPGRGTGFPTTQLVRNGDAVPPYDPERDPSKEDMKRLASGIGSDARVAEVLGHVRDAVGKARAEGRLKKGEGKGLARSLLISMENIPSNAGYRVDQMSEAYAERISEAMLLVHLDIRSEQAKLGHQKDSD